MGRQARYLSDRGLNWRWDVKNQAPPTVENFVAPSLGTLKAFVPDCGSVMAMVRNRVFDSLSILQARTANVDSGKTLQGKRSKSNPGSVHRKFPVHLQPGSTWTGWIGCVGGWWS